MTILLEQQRGIKLTADAGQSSSYDSTYYARHDDGSTPTFAQIATKLASDVSNTYLDPINSIYLYKQKITLTEISEQIVQVDVTWVDKERYDNQAKLDIGSKRIGFSTSGGTAHISTSLNTEHKLPAADAPDTKNAIGLTKEGDVQGADIITPAFRFTVEYRVTNGTITNAYAKTIRDLTGTVNDATFYGFDAGEVLFLGCPDARQELQGDPTISFEFLQMSNLSNYTIGDITGINKDGHEYLWVWYEESEVTADDGLKWIMKKPKYAFVERVYEEGDFSTLGIGTS